MNNYKDETQPQDDSFPTSIYYLLESLDIAQKSAQIQCNRLGNFNVAWELKDELEAITFLISDHRDELTESQIDDCTTMLSLLASIPDSVMSEATSQAENLKAMQDPSWEPIRKHARALRSVLLPLYKDVSAQ